MNSFISGLLCLFTCTDPSYTLQDNKLFHEGCRAIGAYIKQGPTLLQIDNGKYICSIKKRRFNEDEMRAMLRFNKALRNQNTVSWFN